MVQYQMDRDALLERFRGSMALRDAALWYVEARNLLEQLEVCLKETRPQRDSAKHVLWLLMLRIRRYLLALSAMSFQTGERSFTHAIDGYHAIHKSLFETYIEFAVSTVYLGLFQSQGDPQGLSLLERLRLHAEITSLKKNRQHRFRLPAWQAMREKVAEAGFTMQVPESTRALMDAPLEESTERLNSLIEKVQGPKASIKNYKHWFPERSLDGKFFVPEGEDESCRPKNCGSIEWLCKAVMARHTPDPRHRDWWVSAYNNDYDLINLYTHPVMGYDDCFRGTAERSLDLAQMQLSMRSAFHEVVLPPLRVYFRDVWVELVNEEERLYQLHNQTTKVVLSFLYHVHQQDRETLPEGPSLWS